jgi:hypothetical protein
LRAEHPQAAAATDEIVERFMAKLRSQNRIGPNDRIVSTSAKRGDNIELCFINLVTRMLTSQHIRRQEMERMADEKRLRIKHSAPISGASVISSWAAMCPSFCTIV